MLPGSHPEDERAYTDAVSKQFSALSSRYEELQKELATVRIAARRIVSYLAKSGDPVDRAYAKELESAINGK